MDDNIIDNSAYQAGKQGFGSTIGNWFTGNADWKKSQIATKQSQDYNTEMANTAYQRAVQDLKKAGLNPTLAYSSGASTPTSAYQSASSDKSGSTAVVKLITQIASSALKLLTKQK